MQPRTEPIVRRVCNWIRWLPFLLLAIFTTGAAAQTTYRIIPLSAEQAIPFVDINASGQVAFTELANGVFHARFFDGHVVRDLGTLGGPGATAVALNDLGQVTGSASVNADGTLSHAYRWSPRTGMVDLNRPGQGASSGSDINNKGQVTGAAVFDPATTMYRHAFLWRPQTGMVDIGTLDLAASGSVINDAGTIAGWTGGASLHVFRWTRREGMHAITTMYNEFNIANDINAAGHIVGGTAFGFGQAAHAFLWTPREGLIDLGASIADRTEAAAINDSDMVVLNVHNFTDFSHGYVWTRETGLTEIGAGSPQIGTSANDVNNRGQVVGGFDGRAYVWTRAQGVIDLHARLAGAPEGLVLRAGVAISDTGAIVAQGNTGLVLLVPTAGAGNDAPVAGPIQVTGPARAHALLSFSAAFKDTDPGDAHKATWAWGDGASEAATVSERNGAGSVSGQHTYRSPGSYVVKLTVTDSSGRSSAVQRKVVIRAARGPSDINNVEN
jgi:probable HAF family extracellular repeat protein